MKPVFERTPVLAVCPGGHTWRSTVLPGNTLPQTASCPTCDMLASFCFPCDGEREEARLAGLIDKYGIPGAIRLEQSRIERNRRARANRAALRDACESVGLTRCRVNGREVWE